MAPTKRTPEKTNMWEEVLDLVMPYIDNVEDLTSVSSVSRKFYEIDSITRKRVTVHAYYYLYPASLSERFPFIEALTLKGPPFHFNDSGGYAIRLTPWIEELALEFRCLKELHISGLVVHDEDLKTLARTRGTDLRSLKISKCKGFTTKGLEYVSKYCNKLRTLCLECFDYGGLGVKDDVWIHELALNNTVLERFHVTETDFFTVEEQKVLTLLAKNCCNSLISLKIGACHLSNLGDAFRYASRLEHFSGNSWDEERELVGFQFPPNTRSLNIEDLPGYSIILPFLNHLRKLKLGCYSLDYVCQCLLFKSCPNLEVLYTDDECGDEGLLVIGQFCQKLRKLTHDGLVTHVGLIAMAKGCTNLESLNVRLRDISNEALECLGMHLKNLREFRMKLVKKIGITDLPVPLDDGIKDMLLGCKKLERLDITLWYDYGGLTDVGLGYIGKYGANLRTLALKFVGNSNAGLVKLSEGCPKLRELELRGCPFSEQVVTSSVFNIPSLRYVWFDSCDREVRDLERYLESSDLESSDCESSDCESIDRESRDSESSDLESSDRVRCHLALTRPEFELWKKQVEEESSSSD